MAPKFLNGSLLSDALSSFTVQNCVIDCCVSADFAAGNRHRGPGAGVIAFRLNGVVRWIIDVRRFAGSPVLTVTGAPPHAVKIQLKNARSAKLEDAIQAGRTFAFQGQLHSALSMAQPSLHTSIETVLYGITYSLSSTAEVP